MYVGGSGTPILLVHSINAAASAYEVGPIFHALAADRRVYAPDLPGFGFSDRSDRRYAIDLYVDAILDSLDEIAAEHGGAPVDALALSLSSEFLTRAAARDPGRFRSLTLVTPTGFERGSDTRRKADGATREVPFLHAALTRPGWGRPLFDLLVSRPSIRFFLKKTFGTPRIDEGLLAYDYVTAHQPGARFAPFAFVSGRLFAADIRTIYEQLALPVFVPHATRGDFQDVSEIGWTRSRPNWRIQAFPTGALPHFEEPEAFVAALRAFLSDADGYPSSSSGSRSPSP